MPDYHFQTVEFGVSDEGIHLLRNGFNHKTYKYSDIRRYRIGRGREVKNWIVLLAVGCVMASSAVWYAIKMFGIVAGNKVPVIYIEEIIVPVFPLLIGLFCIYISLKKGTILEIQTADNKTEFWPLKKLEKSGHFTDFKFFFESHFSNKG